MIDEGNWKLFTESLQETKNVISIDNLCILVQKYSDYKLTGKDKEFIFETFKSLYDDKGKLIREQREEKYVMLTRLQSARKSLRSKKMQDMVDHEENEAHQAEASKFKGLIQVDENFLINMAIANVKGWKDLWYDVKKIDIDKNGLMDINDLGHLMKDYFPDHLEGKSLHYFFKQFCVSYDKNVINYKPIKDSVNKEVA